MSSLFSPRVGMRAQSTPCAARGGSAEAHHVGRGELARRSLSNAHSARAGETPARRGSLKERRVLLCEFLYYLSLFIAFFAFLFGKRFSWSPLRTRFAVLIARALRVAARDRGQPSAIRAPTTSCTRLPRWFPPPLLGLRWPRALPSLAREADQSPPHSAPLAPPTLPGASPNQNPFDPRCTLCVHPTPCDPTPLNLILNP